MSWPDFMAHCSEQGPAGWPGWQQLRWRWPALQQLNVITGAIRCKGEVLASSKHCTALIHTIPVHLAQSNGGTYLQQQVDVAHKPAKSIRGVHDSGSLKHGDGSSPGLWLWPGQPGAGQRAGWAQQQALQRGQAQA